MMMSACIYLPAGWSHPDIGGFGLDGDAPGDRWPKEQLPQIINDFKWKVLRLNLSLKSI